MFAKYIARQLSAPTGLMGRWVLSRLWNKRNAALNDLAYDCLDLDTHDHVLDVGFGGGYLLGRIAEQVSEGFAAGVDASEAMVAACARRHRALIQSGNLELHCSPVESLPFGSARFNKACTVNSLFYWDDVPQGLTELCRVLKPEGLLVLCVTRKQSIEHKEFAQHGLGLYDDAELCALLEQAGFVNLVVTQAEDLHREFVCITGKK